MWNYRLYNLTIQTILELPNIVTCQIEAPNKADVEINYGQAAPIFDEIHYIKEWKNLIYTIGLVKGKVTTLVNYKRVARYLIQGGESIIVQKMPFGTTIDMESILLELALPSLLFQREYFILNAATIVKDGEAYMFLGDADTGKTTAAVSFLKEGYTILSEDIAAIQYIDGIPHVLPSIPYLALSENIATKEGYDWDDLLLLNNDDAKRAYLLKNDYQMNPIPLKKIYTLTPNGVPSLQLSEVEGEGKFAALAMNIYQPQFFEGYPIEDLYANIAYQLMDDVPFINIERPQYKQTVSQMLRLLQQDINVAQASCLIFI